MPTYRFTIDGDSSPTEETTAALPHDDAAWEFGESIIRSLLSLKLDPEESRVMVIRVDKRVVASIAFNLTALGTRRTLQ